MVTTYVIGGVPRSGKSLLRQRLLEKYNIPGISLDILRDGFTYGMPAFGIDGENIHQPEEERSRILGPYFKGILTTRSFYDDKFVFEGTNLLPKLVAEMKGKNYLKFVFFGYPKVTPDKKLKMVREHISADTDWTIELSDTEIINLINTWIKVSLEYSDTCCELGIKFIDTSNDFEKGIEEGERFLID